MTETRRTVLRARDIRLAGGDVLRVQLESDGDGTPIRLHLSRGFADGLTGGPGPRPSVVVVPGDRIGDLVDAIRELEGEA